MKPEYLSELLRLLGLRQFSPATIFLLLAAFVFFGAFFYEWKFDAKSNVPGVKKRPSGSKTLSDAGPSLGRKGYAIGEKDVSFREKTLVGRVVRVDDGDTLWIKSENEENIRIRFQAIDAPEKGQDFGDHARQRLNSLVYGKTVRVEVDKTDQYGRIVGRIWLDSSSGLVDVEELMLREGLAWHYLKFNKEPKLANAQKEAQDKKTGLWSRQNPVPPWRWRWERRENGDSETK